MELEKSHVTPPGDLQISNHQLEIVMEIKLLNDISVEASGLVVWFY